MGIIFGNYYVINVDNNNGDGIGILVSKKRILKL